MAVYYLAYFLITASFFVKVGRTPTEKRRNQSFFLFLVLFVIVGFRHPSMGVDLVYGGSYGYLGRFSYISELSWRSAWLQQVNNYERGYILFNKLLSLISTDQQCLLIGCAAVSLAMVLYVVYRKSDSPAMSVVVFMGLTTFQMLFSGLRQSLALGICFVALLFIEDRKPIKFAVTVALATLFHYSSWIFLVAYPMYHFPMKRSWRFFSFLIPPLCYLFRHPLFLVFSKLFKENARMDDNNAIVLFLVFYLVYIFCYLFSGERKDTAGLKNLFFAACCIQALGGVNSNVMRLGYYFMNSLILLLPTVTGTMRNRKNARILNGILAACFILFGLYSLKRSSWAQAYPYKWFWDSSI